MELQKLLEENGIHVCSSTALKWRKNFGWTSKATSYCKMVREANVEKRMEWALKNKKMWFLNVIYTDETTVQIETHRRTCCYKRGKKPRYKPKPKHPLKFHVWAGISYRGCTILCIFEGKMNALHPFSFKYYIVLFCPLSKVVTQVDIILSKTMIPSTVLD